MAVEGPEAPPRAGPAEPRRLHLSCLGALGHRRTAPVAVPMKLGARLALMKIGGDGSRCNACGACERACPMDVKVGSSLRAGRRVLSTECILRQLCVNGCPRQVPQVTFGLDLGGPELLRPAPRSGAAPTA